MVFYQDLYTNRALVDRGRAAVRVLQSLPLETVRENPYEVFEHVYAGLLEHVDVDDGQLADPVSGHRSVDCHNHYRQRTLGLEAPRSVCSST